MACTSRVVMKTVLKYYKDGFESVRSSVDVGGGSGAAVAEIFKAHPHIKGFNFDLPHVVGSAPNHPNVTHIGGDMFAGIPYADAIFLKHSRSDEKCLQILHNCRKALSAERNGKVIIVDAVLRPQADSLFDIEVMRFDLKMMVITPGGKERTEEEWNKLLKAGGFSRYQMIKIPCFLSIIEVYID
ncbi:hypothetical protein PTKIN_Ptkin08bG0138800 [Pterospermum kingtungense]